MNTKRNESLSEAGDRACPLVTTGVGASVELSPSGKNGSLGSQTAATKGVESCFASKTRQQHVRIECSTWKLACSSTGAKLTMPDTIRGRCFVLLKRVCSQHRARGGFGKAKHWLEAYPSEQVHCRSIRPQLETLNYSRLEEHVFEHGSNLR
jgi:hypothetical protein